MKKKKKRRRGHTKTTRTVGEISTLVPKPKAEAESGAETFTRSDQPGTIVEPLSMLNVTSIARLRFPPAEVNDTDARSAREVVISMARPGY